MKRSLRFRLLITFVLLLSLFSPISTLAFDGKKYFRQGMKHEDAQEWDKAVEQFALAVSDSPKNPEYRLHLVRALFHASQLYMKKGSTAAKEKDYEAGYVAFRKAYAFDPTNELAKSEMERMVRLQKGLNGDVADDKDPNGVKLIQTGHTQNGAVNGVLPQVPQRMDRVRNLNFKGGIDLQDIIKDLARELELNVLFDADSFRTPNRKVYIELSNVTPARALDYIFLQEGLFFQRVGPRTILIATQLQRQKFQQLVLRTFYLSNAAPKDVAKVISGAIPPQQGRSGTLVLQDEATNSVTIRDTEENIRLIGKLIASLDKDRAEVVMDVAIYEVNKNDLMQLGNQFGTRGSNGVNALQNLGGANPGVIPFGGGFGAGLATAIATGIILPGSVISAFQKKNNTKLLASTQIHAFNNEQSEARIGQRVPVQTAQFLGVGTGSQIPNNQFGQTANVINYEQVGLTLKFKPIVFPNQDVQVEMNIESKDVAGGSTANPVFTERTIKGTARIQNNKTLLLASVAQGTESNGREGLPILGSLPIIGRLFSTPTRDNRQVDVVIAVTPRVIRAPSILPEDEIERPTGSVGVPTNSSLEALLVDEEREEMLAAARRMPTSAVVQLPHQPPTYVKTDTGTPASQKASPAPAAVQTDGSTSQAADTARPAETTALNLNPIDSSVKTLQLNPTADTVTAVNAAEVKPAAIEPVELVPAPAVELKLGAELPEMKAGDKLKIPVLMQGSSSFRSAVMGLKFDDKKLAVCGLIYGDAFGPAGIEATPFLNQNGKMYVSLTAPDGKQVTTTGTLVFIEIEALIAGKPEIAFDRDVLNFLTSEGKNLGVKIQ